MPGHLERITRHWERLGSEDPLWAVYVAPETRGGRWDLNRFWATGAAEIEHAARLLEQTGLPRRRGLALDFGCGVGRLSRPLSERYERVIGVDVSATMLDEARSLNPNNRIDFVLNRRPDLAFVGDGEADLVYSSLVLQHLPRVAAARYLAEFVRCIAIGGAIVVQVATRPTRSLKGWGFRALPAAATGFVQTRFMGYPAPMRMQAMPDSWMRAQIAAAGGRIVATESDPSYQGHWEYTRYVIARAKR